MLLKEQLLASGQYQQTLTSNKLFVWGYGVTGGTTTTLNLFSLAQISAGNSHALALTSDNRLLAWGLNSNGQLGTNDAINRSYPAQVGLKGGWKKISAGSSFSVVVRGDGTLFAWGNNASGQLGDGTTITKSSPTQIGSNVSWLNVDAGSEHVLATNTVAKLWVWGKNDAGQLGISDTIDRSNPVQVSSPTLIGSTSWLQLSAGLSYSTAIDSDSKLYAWGLNTSGQLGLTTNGDTINRSSPVQVGVDSWQLVSAGFGHTAAIRDDSTLWTWGLNTSFQLGLTDTGAAGNTINRSAPVRVTTGSGSGSWKNVSAGNAYTLAIANDAAGLTNNLLFSWGRNQEGQTGFAGSTTLRSTPQQITTGSWALISAGSSFSVATNNNKLLYTWGAFAGGTQAMGITFNRSSPVLVSFLAVNSQSSPVQIGASSWTFVSAGYYYNMAIRADNTLWGWGENLSGQLGINNAITRSSPVQIGTSSWIAVSARNGTQTYAGTAAIRIDNTLWVWGQASYQFGATSISQSWKQIANGASHSVAIKSDNTLWVWGSAASGQIGDNQTAVARSSPVQVTTVSNYVQVGTGKTDSSYAINLSGNLYAWGLNSTGQLGLGDTINRSSPTLVTTNDTTWQFVSGTKGITTNGTLYSWGSNDNGQLGDGTTINKSTPTQIIAGTSFVFTTGSNTARNLAISTTGNLYAWGLNNSGALGDNTTINKSTPIQVSNATLVGVSWNLVFTNNDTATTGHTLAITNTGLLYAWGGNATGQLGDQTTINKSIPTQIGSSSWTAVAAYASASVAINSLGQLFAWGSDANSRLGDALTVNQSSPVLISGGGGNAYSNDSWRVLDASVATSGLVHLLSDNGVIYGWGQNTTGVLGDSTTVSKTSPIQVTSLFLGAYSSPVQVGTRSNWTQVSLGYITIAALNSLGELYCWGPNGGFGTDGSGVLINRYAPFKIGNSSWTQVSQGFYHTAAITSDNRLFVWGRNDNYQLGDDTVAGKSSPIQIGASVPFQIGTGSFVQVAAGTHYTMAVDTNKKLYAWGYNGFGQLGIITDAYSWNMVREGFGHALAIRSDNTLWGWGRNDLGAIGVNDTITRSSPVQIGTNSWLQISATQYTSAGIRSDGALFVWGYGLQQNGWGDGTASGNKSSPTQIGTDSWSQIATGYSHMLGIDAAGRLYGWGTGASLFGTTAIFSWTIASTNSSYTVAVRSDGLLFAWGLNSSGQLGDGTTNNKSSPTQIGTSSWSTVTAGVNHVLAIGSNGYLYSWGNNTQQQLGDNTSISKSSPVLIDSGSWIAIAAGSSTSMAIKSPNTLYTWGIGTSGQLGQYTATKSWSEISAGFSHSLAIRSDSTLFAWGSGSKFQLGLPDGINSPNRSSPTQVNFNSWSKVAAGASHSLGINDTGVLYGWGSNDQGQVYWNDNTPLWNNITTASPDYNFGIKQDGSLWIWGGNAGSADLAITATYNQVISSPTQIGNLSWSLIRTNSIYSGGWAGTAGAITTDGKLYMWGSNISGQLGLSDLVRRSSPVQVGNSSWSQVSVSASGHTLAIRSDGALFAWGLNTSGQLGLTDINVAGDTISRSSPVQLGGTNSWKVVSAGMNHSAAIRQDDTLWVWGNNVAGQLGKNDTINRSSPVQVTLPTTGSWVTIACGSSTTYAISNVGLGTPYSIYAWGFNGSLNLGITDYTTTNKSSPVLVKAGAAGSSFIQVATNHYDTSQADGVFLTSGLTSDGKNWMWGNNVNGQLGDLSTITRSSPVLVQSNEIFTKIPANLNGSTNLAINNENKLFVWGGRVSSTLYLGVDGTSSPVLVGPNLVYGIFKTPTYTINSTIGQGSWTLVEAGDDVSFGIKNNKLYAWGQNQAGQTGVNETGLFTSSPTQIGQSSFSLVSASKGGQFVAAITSDNKLLQWGGTTNSANYGQGLPPLAASAISDNFSWTQIAMGTDHVLAVKSDGGLYVWGQGLSGCLGIGVVADRSSPTQLGTDSWISVAASDNNSWGIKTDGTMWAWGDNKGVGVLGNGALVTTNYSSPIQIGTGTLWSKVVAGGAYRMAAAIDSTGQLYMWGENSSGQLGTGDTIGRSSPTTLPGFIGFIIKDVSIGNLASAAIDRGEGLYTWGQNNAGQLGLKDTIDRSNPVQVGDVNLDGTWSVVAVLGAHFPSGASMLAINYAGKLFAWGTGTSGQLGLTSTVSYSSPVQVGNSKWTQISGSYSNHVFGITSDQQLFAWGDNTFNNGVLGLGDTISRSSPTLLANPAGQTWTRLTNHPGNSFHNYLIVASDNTLYSTGGNNLYGVFGSWNPVPVNANRSSPTQLSGNWTQLINPYTYNFLKVILPNKLSNPVQIGTDNWISVGTGTSFTVGVKSDGTLWSWGQNTANYVLGLGDLITRSVPTQVGSETDWESVSIGQDSSFALKVNKTLYAWGNNNIGQLGKASLIGQQSWKYISNGSSANHFLAISSDDKLFAWGLNTWGQLGNGDKISRSSPVPIGNSSWSIVSANWSHSAGITSDGKLFTWGTNAAGRLGNGLTTDRSSPIQVLGAGGSLGTTSWSAIACGLSSTYAITTTNSLYAWGDSQYGQLGYGTAANRSSPTQVTGNWSSIAAGDNSAYAINTVNKLFSWGRNEGGQLGDGTTLDRSSPVAVGANSWATVGAGTTHAVAALSIATLAGITGLTSNLGGTAAQPGNSGPLNEVGLCNGQNGKIYFDMASGSGINPGDIIFTSISPTFSGKTSWTLADGPLIADTSGTWTFTSNLNCNIPVYVWGAGGGATTANANTAGGAGGYTGGKVSFTSASSYRMIIGQGGAGGAHNRNAAGAGGGSGIEFASTSTPVIVAGGGGGGYSAVGLGGAGGGNLAQTGANTGDAPGGAGGTQAGPGAGGVGARRTGASGVGRNGGGLATGTLAFAGGTGFGNGGAGAYNASDAGSGGGGGGYYGGGEGGGFLGGAPGGGGSGYYDPTYVTEAYTNAGYYQTTPILQTLFSWGLNSSGQLGDGTTVSKSSPVQTGATVSNIPIITEVKAALTSSFAKTSTGLLYSWGNNTNGLLGTGDTINRSNIIQVSAPAQVGSWTTIGAAQAVLVLANTNLLYAWGLNANGQFGNLTTINRSDPVLLGPLPNTTFSTPVQIGGSWSVVEAGLSFTLAKDMNNNLYTWGKDSNGQLGLG